MQGTAGITGHREKSRAITLGYKAALAATALLFMVSATLNHIEGGKHKDREETLNSADLQCGQSERIVSAMRLATNPVARKEAVQTVRQTLLEWRANQNRLADYVNREGGRDVEIAVQQAAPSRQVVERAAEEFVASNGAYSPAQEAVEAQHRFVHRQGGVLRALEAETAGGIARLQTAQDASGILLLLCLTLQSRLLFRPLARRDDVIEKQAPEHRAAEQHFGKMIEDLPVGVVLLEGNTFYINRYLRNLTGLENLDLASGEDCFQRLLGEEAVAFRELCHSGTAQEVSRVIPITCENGHRCVEISTHRMDTTEIWLVVDVTEYVAAQERLQVLVEQRKEYEEALNLANEELKLAQSIVNVGSWQSSVDFNDFYWSPEMYRAMGLDPAHGQPTFAEFLDLLHPEDVEEFHKLAVDAAIEGREWQFEHRVVLKNGLERTVISTIQPWLGRGRVIGTILDVTQARKEARRVAESETLFRTSMNAIQAGVVFMDADGQIKTVNPKAAEILGLDQDQLLGLKPISMQWECIREDGSDLPIDEYPLAIAFRERRVVEATIYGVRQSCGNVVWININAAPLMIEGQEAPLGAIASFTDVTDLREKQQLLMEEMNRTNEQALTLEMQKIELEDMNEKLQALASQDGLTGLNNHRSFQEFYERQFAISRRSRSPLSLLLLDVDHFKTFNDEFGHQAGDEVLKAVARALQGAARESDYVARYGGEEFVVVLSGTDAAGSILAAERFRKVIESQEWPHRVTASFGAATLSPEVESREQLISLADAALYRSKHDGRNRSTHADTLAKAA